MNYIIFDLEFNQNYSFTAEKKSLPNSNLPFEIIQIGAIKLDEHLQPVSTFDRLVKPNVYTNIHPFVKDLTGITTEMLNTAKPFKEVYNEFVTFLGSDHSILCIWGMSDIKELLRNITYAKLDSSLISKEYINVQRYASKYFSCPKGTNIGLRNAVELLNIPIETKFHNALNDAYYTVETFKKIYTEQIKPTLYITQPHTILNKPKQKLDVDKLFQQFEKMFNREMTIEEKKLLN